MRAPVVLLAAVLVGLLSGVACRRENPNIRREATAAAGRAATAAAAPTPTLTPAVAAGQAPVAVGAPGRQAKISAGNLGVGSQGISAGIQLWSKAGGILAGGATMAGTVSDGATVDLLGEDTFLGQKYYRVKSPTAEGWVDGRFIQVP